MGLEKLLSFTHLPVLTNHQKSKKLNKKKKIKKIKGKKEDKKYIENYRFPDFFIPNTDSLWQGSEFVIEHERIEKTLPQI